MKETRQALVLCIDRQRLADELFSGQSRVPDSYIHPDHPLANPQARRYAYDPQAGGNLLTSAGWSDADGDPATPRLAQGVAGVTDGTPLAFAFLTTVEDEKQRAAQVAGVYAPVLLVLEKLGADLLARQAVSAATSD